MGDQKIAYKSFNPYDLGAVARASRESRDGHHGPRSSEPYVPPSSRQNGASSASHSNSGEPGKEKP